MTRTECWLLAILFVFAVALYVSEGAMHGGW